MTRTDVPDASETTALLAAGSADPTGVPDEAVAILASDLSRSRSKDGAAQVAGHANGYYGTSARDEESAPPAGRGEEGPDQQQQQQPDTIPNAQVFWLCLARLVEPVAFFSIFPYVNKMVKHNGGLADADVGFYTGLIESLFSLTQACVMMAWGRLADRAGRKPVLVVSLAGVAAATSCFGLARSVAQMIALRCCAGVFAGTVLTIRAMLAEHSTPRTQARVFSWFAFSGNLGIFLGPLIGGTLVDPARQYGGVFKHVRFFTEYPYALSSLAVGLLAAVACVTSALFVEETLVPEAKIKKSKATNKMVNKAGSESVWQLVHEPGVTAVLVNFAWLSVVANGYTIIVPLWWFTPIELGGFSFTPPQIALMLALNGIAQATWLLVAFPPLQHRLGTNGVMSLCGAVFPLFFGIAPVANALLRAGQVAAFWAFFPPVLVITCGVAMSYTAAQLAINEVSPSPHILGTLTAFSLVLTSVTRAVCPALFTSLFALGARTQLLGGYAIWAFLAALAAGFCVATRYLPDYDEIRRLRAERERQEDEEENED